MKGLVLLALLSGHGVAYGEPWTDQKVCEILQDRANISISTERIWQNSLCGGCGFIENRTTDQYSCMDDGFKKFMAENPVCDYYQDGQLGEVAHWMIVHSDLCGYTEKSPSVNPSVLDAGIVAFFEYTEKSEYCDNQENIGMDQGWRYDVCQYRDRNINWYE